MAEEKTIKELENAIYEAYYKQNPEGDARLGLWGEVMDASKSENPREELEEILSRYE